jgi:cell division protein FtsI/penicillin-binding protein 2
MGVFRQMAIGGNEAQFTMLRLAAILGTVSSGQRLQPYLIESAYDRSLSTPKHQMTYERSETFMDLRPILGGVRGVQSGYASIMTRQMENYLRLVCNRAARGTGWYFNSNNSQVFMSENDTATPEDESLTRRDDFGKTGTADHGQQDNYDDSIFVYRHGRYLIAIWLERADGPGVAHPAHALLNDVVKFIDRLEPSH